MCEDRYKVHCSETARNPMPSACPTSCAICGNDFGKVFFKGKTVCEDCLEIIKYIK